MVSTTKQGQSDGPITYGAVESRRREVHRSGGRIRRSTSVTERPGISPRLTVEYLLGCTAFLELKDLGFPLVEKREIPNL